MDKIKKTLDFSTKEGKKVLASIKLIKEELKSSSLNNKTACDHDLEDICAYTENNLSSKDYERVDKIISECDSCFETYYQLKEVYQESIKTPDSLKNKVRDIEKEKKNIFSNVIKKLKTNFTYTGSGVLVGFATAVFMFMVILPNKQTLEINSTNNGIVFNSIENTLDSNLFFEALDEKKKGNLDLAIEKLEVFLEKNPDSLEVEFELAKIYKSQNKMKSAKRHFEEYINKANKLKMRLDSNINEAYNEVNK
jgi:tetratricopeptide (TPR) repeat protein